MQKINKVDFHYRDLPSSEINNYFWSLNIGYYSKIKTKNVESDYYSLMHDTC